MWLSKCVDYLSNACDNLYDVDRISSPWKECRQALSFVIKTQWISLYLKTPAGDTGQCRQLRVKLISCILCILNSLVSSPHIHYQFFLIKAMLGDSHLLRFFD